jgi:hypothetical protein
MLVEAGERLHAELFAPDAAAECSANAAELLILEADGARYRTTEADGASAAPATETPEDDGLSVEERDSGWREDKIGVVIRALPGKVLPKGKYQAPEELVKTYVATTGALGEFEHDMEIEAERRGVARAKEVVAISDNGHGLPTFWERLFKALHLVLIRITDFYHCAERLGECAKVIRGEGSTNRRERGKLFRRLRTLLWNGKVENVIAILREEATRLAPEPKSLRDLDGQPAAQTLWKHVFYFEKYKDTMDYPAYRAKGWPMGSGSVESACGQFGNRVKHARMRWTRRAADALHVVKAAILSGDDRWAKRWPPPIPVLDLPESIPA